MPPATPATTCSSAASPTASKAPSPAASCATRRGGSERAVSGQRRGRGAGASGAAEFLGRRVVGERRHHQCPAPAGRRCGDGKDPGGAGAGRLVLVIGRTVGTDPGRPRP